LRRQTCGPRRRRGRQQRTVDCGTKVADLQTAIIAHKSKRCRNENVEERQKAAAAKLAETKVDDDADGDKKLMRPLRQEGPLPEPATSPPRLTDGHTGSPTHRTPTSAPRPARAHSAIVGLTHAVLPAPWNRRGQSPRRCISKCKPASCGQQLVESQGP
jgi:hypothetical protein